MICHWWFVETTLWEPYVLHTTDEWMDYLCAVGMITSACRLEMEES